MLIEYSHETCGRLGFIKLSKATFFLIPKVCNSETQMQLALPLGSSDTRICFAHCFVSKSPVNVHSPMFLGAVYHPKIVPFPNAPCMDYLPTLGEKWPHSRGNVGKYSLHGASGITMR